MPSGVSGGMDFVYSYALFPVALFEVGRRRHNFISSRISKMPI